MTLPQSMWAIFDSRAIAAIKILVASAGALVLAWSVLAWRRGDADRSRVLRDRLLAAAGILAFACWWNLGRFHFVAGYLQLNDQYHYYLGAKYAKELGYTRLYACTAIADTQDGLRDRVLRRWVRNLETNELEPGAVALANPDSCPTFTPERWQMFKHDVAWFRSRFAGTAWDQLQIDHGYNAPPTWGIAGHLLANLGPASDRQIVLLSLIDPVLLAAMWASVWWAFGWRTLCVALLWWGTNYPARYSWTGGSFLRADWLMFTVVSICLLRRRHHATAGASLAYAALLRIFPAIIACGLALRAAWLMWKRRSLRPAPADARFAVGGMLAVAVLVPLSLVASGGGWRTGVSLWQDFVANSRKHYATPATNNVGLRVLAAYAPESRLAATSDLSVETPLDTWTAARRHVLEERQPFYWIAVLAFLVLFARAVARHEDWIALALGVALLPVATELTCYYYSVLLVLGFLWQVAPWTGVALALAAALSNLPAGVLRMEDDVFAAVTVVILALVTVVTATLARKRGALSPLLVRPERPVRTGG